MRNKIEITDVIRPKDLVTLEIDGKPSVAFLVVEETDEFTKQPLLKLRSITGQAPLVIILKHFTSAISEQVS